MASLLSKVKLVFFFFCFFSNLIFGLFGKIRWANSESLEDLPSVIGSTIPSVRWKIVLLFKR